MPDTSPDTMTRDRLIMTLIGAVAGLSVWVLFELLPDRVANERLQMLVAMLVGGFFATFLAATGPLRYARAAVAAGVVSVPAAILLWTASFRYDRVDDFLETGHPLVAYSVILVVGLPFMIALQRPDEGWRNYPALFTQSWNIVVRYAAAWLFVGVVWVVVLLSDALFGLVGLTIIEDLLDIEVVPYLLTGAVLGMALAVVVELSEYISPYLVLRLLRLLLPVVLVVTIVFLMALPLQGLKELFGGFSAAGTLLAMTVGIATLITSALDRDDQEATDSRLLKLSAQGLALAMPILTALAIYSIWLRVADYGWTPARLAGMGLALIVLGYGVLYAVAVLRARRWQGRIRRSNINMALISIGVAILWLSPVLNPEEISAKSQMARINQGDLSAEQIDLWFLGKELGRAGEAAIAQIAASDTPAHVALHDDIARLEQAEYSYQFAQSQEAETAPDRIAEITSALTVLPEGASLPGEVFKNIPPRMLDTWAESCAEKTPQGHPGCIAVRADLLPETPEEETVFIRLIGVNRVMLSLIRSPDDRLKATDFIYLTGELRDLGPEVLDEIRDGGFQLAPVTRPALMFGDTTVIGIP